MTRSSVRRLVLIAVIVAGCGGSTGSDAPDGGVAPTGSTSPSPAATASAATTRPTTSARPTPTPVPTIGAGEPWFVFQTQGPRGYGVHLVRPDGSGFHKWPVSIPGTHEHPDWSPDGMRILLNTVMTDDTEDLWIGNADGSDAHLVLDCVAPCVWLDEAAWSPDGERIAFQRLVIEPSGHLVSTLELLDPETGGTEVVLSMPTQQVVLAPRWSPDGDRLVVEVVHLPEDALMDPDWGAIGVVDLQAATPVVELLTEQDFSNSPDWSPDGRRLLLSRPTGETGADVWLIDPDGGDPRQLTDLGASGGWAEQPAFLPDGSGVVFRWTRADDQGVAIGQIGIDGGEPVNATGDLEIDGMHPRLRPMP